MVLTWASHSWLQMKCFFFPLLLGISHTIRKRNQVSLGLKHVSYYVLLTGMCSQVICSASSWVFTNLCFPCSVLCADRYYVCLLQNSDNCPTLHKLLRVVNNSVGTFHKATLTQIYHSYLNTPYLVLAFARNPFYREHCYRSDTVINLSVKSSAK